MTPRIKHLSATALRKNGRIIFEGRDLPAEMPVMKGGYSLVAIIGKPDEEYGQVVHNPAFYTNMATLVYEHGCCITALISIHPDALKTIPEI